MVCAGGESGQVGGTDQGSPECWSGVFLWQIMHYCPLIPAGIFNLNYLNSLSICRPQVQCGQGAGAEAAAVVLADYGEGQLGLSRIPEPTNWFPAWTRECYPNATRGSVSGVGHRGSEYGVVGSGANSR